MLDYYISILIQSDHRLSSFVFSFASRSCSVSSLLLFGTIKISMTLFTI